jgi:hypothetical protein
VEIRSQQTHRWLRFNAPVANPVALIRIASR